MTEIADALRDTLLALTRIPSPIGEEAALCDHVEARLTRSLGGDAITRFHDSLIVHAAQRETRPASRSSVTSTRCAPSTTGRRASKATGSTEPARPT